MHLKKHKTTNFVLIASHYAILKNHPFCYIAIKIMHLTCMCTFLL